MPALPTDPYREILSRAQSELDRVEQLRLAQVLTHATVNDSSVTSKLADLEGLGKAVWEGVKADEYVAEERDSWG